MDIVSMFRLWAIFGETLPDHTLPTEELERYSAVEGDSDTRVLEGTLAAA